MKIRPNKPFKISTFALLILFALCATGPYGGLPEDADELIAKKKAVEDTIKRVKISMLDRQWFSALEDLDVLINQFPRNEQIEKAYFLKAKALSNIKGKEEEAFKAYDIYISRFSSRDLSLWLEEAKIAKSALAKSLILTGKRDYLKYLVHSLKHEKNKSVKTYAAIQLAELRDKDYSLKALPILVDSYVQEKDPIIRNTIALRIISIDPSKLPPVQHTVEIQGEGKGKTVILFKGNRKPAKVMPSWITIKIYSKKDKKNNLNIKLPIGLAQAAINVLPSKVREEIKNEMKQEGFDFDAFWFSLQNLEEKSIFRLEEEDEIIEIRLE
jgi:hypothetical protein